jgi:hypothetical protein
LSDWLPTPKAVTARSGVAFGAWMYDSTKVGLRKAAPPVRRIDWPSVG